ncbi:MAG: RDD family protein [Baekduia sp.]
MSASVPPPGWVEPSRAVAAQSHLAYAHDDLRSENRRSLDGKRVGARVLDWLIVAPIGIAAAWEWGWNFGTFALVQCLLLILNHVCEVTTGATPGKRLFGLRVASLRDGGLPSPRQAAVRGVIGIFEFGLIAAIAIISTKGRRRLGDLAAGTAVVSARKHPVASRPLFAGALAYPVVWAVPAIIACVLGARGVLPDSYRAQADNWCRGYTPPMSATVNLSVSEALQFDAAMAHAIETLEPPHAWRGAHEDLVRRLKLRVATRQQWAQAHAANADRTTEAMWVVRDQRERAADDAALAAQGFHDCAHRA